ncbi:hypothetical protein [uncultured Gammaproteobacteria bacterium]|jgi:hypothetical protein|nr:hypothetical protein [uncultured Gammaproteobacteria bacterium]CAC9644183.1 hypothetical protein [uncultured Gammaproteobacteria bacterium]
MKTIQLYVLGVLLLSSFNVLGEECNMKTSDKSSYAIKSSIYLYLNGTELNTCKCQAGYEFDPYIPKGRIFFKGREENSFSEKPLALEGMRLQCVTPRDDTKLSTADWAVPVSVLSVMVSSVAVGRYILKQPVSSRPPVSSGDTPNTNTIDVSEDGYLTPANTRPPVPVEYEHVSSIDPVYDDGAAGPLYNDPDETVYNDASSTPIYDDGAAGPLYNDPMYDDGAAGPLYNDPDETVYNDASSTPIYDDGVAGPLYNDGSIELTSAPRRIPVNPHYELEDQIGDQVESIYSKVNTRNMLPDNEVTVRARDLMPSSTADASIRNRPPSPEGIYDEISNNVNSDSKTQCSIQ